MQTEDDFDAEHPRTFSPELMARYEAVERAWREAYAAHHNLDTPLECSALTAPFELPLPAPAAGPTRRPRWRFNRRTVGAVGGVAAVVLLVCVSIAKAISFQQQLDVERERGDNAHVRNTAVERERDDAR